MHWLKRNLRKIGILSIIVAVGLLLVWVAWASFSILGMRTSMSTAGRVQVVPTVNATALVVDVLKQQDDKARRDNSFLGVLLNALGGSVGGCIGGIGTMFIALAAILAARSGFTQWLGNREDEQKKQEKEQSRWREEREEGRFQAVVSGLGSKDIEAKVGAAIMLRTFSQKGYEQFHSQTFDLAVAHLRLPRTSDPVQDPGAPLPLTTLSQALIVVFKEAFPLARDGRLKEQGVQFRPESFDATGIQLDNAYLVRANLKQMWGPQASLRKANLNGAYLNEADLNGAYLNEANLSGADLSGTILHRADLSGASLERANLEGTDLSGTRLERAHLSGTHLEGAYLDGVHLEGAYLIKAHLEGALLEGAHLEGALLIKAHLEGAYLIKAHLEGAYLEGVHLSGADLHGAKGLTKEQRAAYRAQGALVDEEPASSVSQEPVSSSPPLAPEKVQASSPQETLPTPDADPSNGMSSQIGPDQGTSGEAAKGGEGGRTP